MHISWLIWLSFCEKLGLAWRSIAELKHCDLSQYSHIRSERPDGPSARAEHDQSPADGGLSVFPVRAKEIVHRVV
jgi:hypothetical protein